MIEPDRFVIIAFNRKTADSIFEFARTAEEIENYIFNTSLSEDYNFTIARIVQTATVSRTISYQKALL